MIKISTSILSADFAKLGDEVRAVTQAGTDYIHFDVMDGSFVPNITIGDCVIKSARKHSDLPFDVHLMIDNPEKHIENFAKSGADIITIHAEATTHLDRTLALIKSFNIKCGVSLTPATNESTLDYVLDKLDLILVMTVNPGFGGQSFLTSQLPKIEKISSKIKNSGRKIELEVDGGINPQTAPLVIKAGADVLVSGSYIFNSASYADSIKKLRVK